METKKLIPEKDENKIEKETIINEIDSDQKDNKEVKPEISDALEKAKTETSNEPTDIRIKTQDFPAVVEKYQENSFVKKTEELVKVENVEADNFEKMDRSQLIELLETTVKIQDITKIKQKVASIKVAFLKVNKVVKEEKLKAFVKDGGKEDEFVVEFDNLEEKFKLLFDIYKQNKAKYNAELETLKISNLALKKKVLDDLKELINSEETLKKTYDEFKILQDRWKEIGLVPQNEVNNLWQNYHFLVELFFDKVKINKELRDLDLKKNLKSKIILCEKTEDLLLETSIIKSFKELQKFHDQWKEIGPVPQDNKDEIWDRFKTATDKINERRREYYSNIHETQKENLEAKTALCEKAEEYVTVENTSINEWQESTNKINELMEVWRGVGPAPKKYNDEIWNRFKGTLNSFFDNKKGFYNKLKEQQLNNYNLKLNLCTQAEGIKESTDWQKTTNDLIRLQKDWKSIGPVPKKYSDKIWKRFRAACDEFFNNKAAFFSRTHEREEENLNLKNELIKKISEFEFGDDKNENLKLFKEFQREWINIGHVPIKEKDKVQKEFRKVLDSKMESLKINESELNVMNYKARFENLKDNRDSRNMLYKERNYLTNKITKLKDNIILWENNMGFFASSKNADLLKLEFEKKIKKAKSDLVVLETKLKVLHNTKLD
jgi:hypothetical protein